MINLHQNSKIYIICPANSATGGPELLHQLGHKLRNHGYDAYMYYLPSGKQSPVHPNYVQYGVPFVNKVENSADNWVIFPETLLGMLFQKQLKRTQKVIWWLSVDNYFSNLQKPRKSFLSRLNAFLRGRSLPPSTPDLGSIAQHKNIIHLAQSVYALNFLKDHQFDQVAYLSDFLSSVFIEESTRVDKGAKKNQVLYNPKKGFEFTRQLIKAAPDITWIPLENMSPQQVAQTLAQSKVYIDFGHHPGKDRFPREAALMACCIITGKKGAAAYREDLPIASDFKFEDQESEIPAIIQQINTCLHDYENQLNRFSDYVERTKREEAVFDADLSKLFKRV